MFQHVVVSLLWFILLVYPMSQTLTTSEENKWINGARIRNLSPSTITTSSFWDIIVNQDNDQWGLWINTDSTWGFDPTLPSSLNIHFHGNTISTSSDLLISFSDGMDTKYATIIIRLNGQNINEIAPGCDSIYNPSQSLMSGDVYNTMADLPPPGNRTCRPAYIDAANTCSYTTFGVAATIVWPLTFTINNYPLENYSSIIFHDSDGYSSTHCGFSDSFTPDIGANIWLTTLVNDNYEIYKINLNYSLLPTPNPTINPSISPTLYPILKPTTNPTFTPSKQPSLSPTIYPTENPVTNKPSSLTPTLNPTILPTYNPSASPTNNPSIYISPSRYPTINPSLSPTTSTTTYQPSTSSTIIPTILPTILPTINPTINPPSVSPTINPSLSPLSPTIHPTIIPTIISTIIPTINPTIMPTIYPTVRLTYNPSVSPSPTFISSITPTTYPTINLIIPTTSASQNPSKSPTIETAITNTEHNHTMQLFIAVVVSVGTTIMVMLCLFTLCICIYTRLRKDANHRKYSRTTITATAELTQIYETRTRESGPSLPLSPHMKVNLSLQSLSHSTSSEHSVEIINDTDINVEGDKTIPPKDSIDRLYGTGTGTHKVTDSIYTDIESLYDGKQASTRLIKGKEKGNNAFSDDILAEQEEQDEWEESSSFAMDEELIVKTVGKHNKTDTQLTMISISEMMESKSSNRMVHDKDNECDILTPRLIQDAMDQSK